MPTIDYLEYDNHIKLWIATVCRLNVSAFEHIYDHFCILSINIAIYIEHDVSAWNLHVEFLSAMIQHFEHNIMLCICHSTVYTSCSTAASTLQKILHKSVVIKTTSMCSIFLYSTCVSVVYYNVYEALFLALYFPWENIAHYAGYRK